MIQNRLTKNATIVMSSFLVCTGCVERDETITIGVDGAVSIELEYEGSQEEMSQGDAMPSAVSGWDVTRTTKKDGDDVNDVLTSSRRFAPGEELPWTFAAADDPDADLYLDFPTTVRIEHRADGIYYYFHRAYAPRRWADIQRWEDFFFDDGLKKLSEKPVEELTVEERVKIVEAFAGMEAIKQLQFCKTAIAESHPDLPVEYGLMARRALIDFYTRLSEKGDGSIERLIERCGALPEDQQGECFDEEAEQILGEAYNTYIQSLHEEAGLTPSEIAAFELAYERAERYRKITEQLGGHNFEIWVEMPGTIIAHNALDDDVDVDEDENTSTVEFEFDGKSFRDNPQELIAVSRLDYKAAREMRNRPDDSDR
jgi:hypothetical protein